MPSHSGSRGCPAWDPPVAELVPGVCKAGPDDGNRVIYIVTGGRACRKSAGVVLLQSFMVWRFRRLDGARREAFGWQSR